MKIFFYSHQTVLIQIMNYKLYAKEDILILRKGSSLNVEIFPNVVFIFILRYCWPRTDLKHSHELRTSIGRFQKMNRCQIKRNMKNSISTVIKVNNNNYYSEIFTPTLGGEFSLSDS